MPEIAIVAPVGDSASGLLDGLAREGVPARACWYGQPELERRLFAVRPDAVVFWLDEEAQRDSSTIASLAERLRALAAPSLGVIPDATARALEPALLALDDFVLAPARAAEVVLRLRLAALRRGPELASGIVVGELRLDPEGFRASVAGRPLELTYKEFELLRFLLVNRGKVVSRQAILNHVWGYDFYGGLRTVDAHIRRLRSKIEPYAPTAIETIRNVGYRAP